MKRKIINKLKKVLDFHIGENIYDLGLIKKIKVDKKTVIITFQPTSEFCPMLPYYVNEIENLVKQIKGINKVKVQVKK